MADRRSPQEKAFVDDASKHLNSLIASSAGIYRQAACIVLGVVLFWFLLLGRDVECHCPAGYTTYYSFEVGKGGIRKPLGEQRVWCSPSYYDQCHQACQQSANQPTQQGCINSTPYAYNTFYAGGFGPGIYELQCFPKISSNIYASARVSGDATLTVSIADGSNEVTVLGQGNPVFTDAILTVNNYNNGTSTHHTFKCYCYNYVNVYYPYGEQTFVNLKQKRGPVAELLEPLPY